MYRPVRFIRQLLASSVLAAAVAPAHALGGWFFNPLGTGFANAVEVSELTVGGFGFIEQSLSWDYLGIAFEEHGAYQVLMPAVPAGMEITATYAVDGHVGLLGNGFSGGTINLYADTAADFGTANGTFGADNGVLIASFTVVGGLVDPLGHQAALMGSAVDGTLAAGYFFDPYGTDLSTTLGVGLSLGVQSQVFDPDGTQVVAELACAYGGFTGPGCDGSAYQAALFDLAYATVQDVGTARLTYNSGVPVVAVPEPASALMMLTGLLGIGVLRRFRR